jgi:hypothetical protein
MLNICEKKKRKKDGEEGQDLIILGKTDTESVLQTPVSSHSQKSVP